MLSAAGLAAAIANTPTQILDHSLYRAVDLEALFGFHHTPPYPQPRPLWSLGAPKHGARFTPPGGPASLYMAEDVTTALAEAAQVPAIALKTHHTKIDPIPPKVMFTAEVHLETVLDVTIPAVQTALGTSIAELTGPWRHLRIQGAIPPTQELGQAVFSSGRYQAIRYPSAKSPGLACVVIFTDRLETPAFIEVFDPHNNIRTRIP